MSAISNNQFPDSKLEIDNWSFTGNWNLGFGNYYQALSTYSPLSVLTRKISPSLINSGANSSSPVSIFTSLLALLAVSPRTAGAASATFSSTLGGHLIYSGLLS